MRVVSGLARGHKLICLPGDDIRPTSDKVKGAIFSSIGDDITGCAFLDIFSGSGAIGIEALSRSAGEIVFVESEREHVKIIEKNVEHIINAVNEPCYKIINTTALNALNMLSADGKMFDVIFMDPPYRQNLWKDVLESIHKTHLLKSGGIIIIEMAKDEEIPSCEHFEIFKSKHYGKTSVYYIRNFKEN
ncbi:16S rRNA (guanine(966)-N(2))-methyltransferase RsmD [Tyzzerella sp. OttesenSCG-928-J15]|nr:16S rRNA (guanine(966)-N(2))-methyltransferase RsmD [Tyzzerella sp. OttesenSCG-928-J15]